VTTHPTQAPPTIPGFEYIEWVGSGGYANVYAYQELMPYRRVAVKVLQEAFDDATRAAFTAEANLMAQVSEHPFIVTIFAANIAADGHPYLVMEYYPGADFLQRSRAEQFSVIDVLRIGIQLAGAVETAHRAGILHRDIKPANILSSAYGMPGLTDFGIATAAGGDDHAVGLSLPWSAPEVLRDERADRRADVYSLGATLFTLLTGRSPFEIPGGPNTNLDFQTRIERTPAPPTGRADVPATLERVLTATMAKRPELRPSSAEDLGRLLQSVETELRLPMTPLQLPSPPSSGVRRSLTTADDDATRWQGILTVDPQPRDPELTSGGVITGLPMPGAHVPSGDHEEPERVGLLAAPAVADTIARSSSPASRQGDEPSRTRRGPFVAAAAVIGAVGLATVGVLLFSHSSSGDNSSTATTAPFAVAGDSALTATVAVPTDLAGQRSADGTVTFTWSSADSQPGDTFVWQRTGTATPGPVESSAAAKATLTGVAANEPACIDVRLRRSNGRASDAVHACAN
jgi:serine/threonine protein kinase